jgi:hypothetical protein
MPRTKKGTKILRAMQKKYGKKKGASVFYASENKGKIKGVHKKGYRSSKQRAAKRRRSRVRKK